MSSRRTSTTPPSATSALKFVHYRPRTVILNNPESDHADIFADPGAIETQFHHLVRTILARSTGALSPTPGEDSRRALERGWLVRVGMVQQRRPRWNAVGSWAQPRRCSALDGVETLGNAWPCSAATTAKMRLPRSPPRAMPGCWRRRRCIAALSRHQQAPAEVKRARSGGVTGLRRLCPPSAIATHPGRSEAGWAETRNRGASSCRKAGARPNTMKLGTMKDQLPASLAAADAVFLPHGID